MAEIRFVKKGYFKNGPICVLNPCVIHFKEDKYWDAYVNYVYMRYGRIPASSFEMGAFYEKYPCEPVIAQWIDGKTMFYYPQFNRK